jgi:hypothetical protein
MLFAIQILAIYTLSIVFRQLDGPFDLFQKARLWLLRLEYVGPFVYKLLECPYCIGFHCGWMVYLLSCPSFSLGWFFLWGFAGSSIVAILDRILERPTT